MKKWRLSLRLEKVKFIRIHISCFHDFFYCYCYCNHNYHHRIQHTSSDTTHIIGYNTQLFITHNTIQNRTEQNRTEQRLQHKQVSLSKLICHHKTERMSVHSISSSSPSLQPPATLGTWIGLTLKSEFPDVFISFFYFVMLLYIHNFLFFSVTRDEQNAGKIDEMLAQLEFI